MSLMRPPEACVGPRPVFRMLPKWPNSWLPGRSPSTGLSCSPGCPQSIGMVIRVMTSPGCVVWWLITRRLTRKRERKTGNGYLHFGHSDELATTYWGELPGLDARIMEKAVDQKADEIIPADQRLAVAERRALALAAICQDSLYQSGSSESAPVDVAVIVDADTAAESDGEKGVSVLAGPRLGPGSPRRDHLQRERRPDRYHRGRQTARSGTHVPGPWAGSCDVMSSIVTVGCTVDSCPFNYRLEVHHVIPWSHGGRTDADNLITLCWFHHHVSVHREGLQIIRIGISRVRLKRPR